jgi:hypothetical protein
MAGIAEQFKKITESNIYKHKYRGRHQLNSLMENRNAESEDRSEKL